MGSGSTEFRPTWRCDLRIGFVPLELPFLDCFVEGAVRAFMASAMAQKAKDPTSAIRRRASRFAEVEEGSACSQTSFKTNKKAFLFIGMQGGCYKAMFKLQESLQEAASLAGTEPDVYEVGKGGWVTARFTAGDPLPESIWRSWLEEGYRLCRPKPKKTAAKKRVRRTTPS